VLLVWTKSVIADTLRLLVSPGRKQTVCIYKELVFGRDCIGGMGKGKNDRP
jgi:hypothetical protein